MQWKERPVLIKAATFVMPGAGVGTFCLGPPGRFTRSHNWSRPKRSHSASLFSRPLQDRDGCKALDYHLSIGGFDKIEEKSTSKQELSWNEEDQIWVSFKRCRMDRHPVVIGQSDIPMEISKSAVIKTYLKVPMLRFRQRFRCLSCCIGMKVLV